MRVTVDKLRSFNKRNISPKLKATAWKSFLDTFSGNNPITYEDENFLYEAKERVRYWLEEQERLDLKTKIIAKARQTLKLNPEVCNKEDLTGSFSYTDPIYHYMNLD